MLFANLLFLCRLFFWTGVKDDTMMMKNELNNSLMVNKDVMKKGDDG